MSLEEDLENERKSILSASDKITIKDVSKIRSSTLKGFCWAVRSFFVAKRKQDGSLISKSCGALLLDKELLFEGMKRKHTNNQFKKGFIMWAIHSLGVSERTAYDYYNVWEFLENVDKVANLQYNELIYMRGLRASEIEQQEKERVV